LKKNITKIISICFFFYLKDDTSANEFQLKLLKYATTTAEGANKDTVNEDTDTDAYTDADSDADSKAVTTEIIDSNECSNEITIDDLPAKMSMALERMEQSTKEINIGTEILDRIIMESIADGFVGDGEALPEAAEERDESGDDEQAKSEASTSGSENFVLLSSGSCSDQVMVESPDVFVSPNTTVAEADAAGGVGEATFV